MSEKLDHGQLIQAWASVCNRVTAYALKFSPDDASPPVLDLCHENDVKLLGVLSEAVSAVAIEQRRGAIASRQRGLVG